jgi:hypothetical protein
MRGKEVKLCRGGGQLVAHSSEPPQPQGSSTLTMRCVLPGGQDVPDEEQRGDTQDRCSHGGNDVQRGEVINRQIIAIAPRHALHAQPVLNQERDLEADEEQPEVDLPRRSSSILPVILGHQK